MVSNRAPPTGHLLTSKLLAFLCSQKSMTLLPKSKMESMPVARRESDSDEIAAYTGAIRTNDPESIIIAILTLNDTQGEIRNETGPYSNFDLNGTGLIRCENMARFK